MNFFNLPFFQLWVQALQASFFHYKSIFGYHRLYFLKETPKAFLQLKMYELICTFRLHPLHYVTFLKTPQICVINVFIHSCLNFHFYFPNVSLIKSDIFHLSNAPSTMSIFVLDPEISQIIFQMFVYLRPFLGDFICKSFLYREMDGNVCLYKLFSAFCD